MSLTITHEPTIRMAQRLAALTGQDVEAAIGKSVEKALKEANAGEADLDRRAAEFAAIGKRFAARLDEPMHSSDIDALLYGHDGLPR